ncbi:MAG: type II toxin-antitoxin system VapC family toxin [Thermoplasmata archaeon]
MIFIDTSIFVDVLRSNGPRSSLELFKKIETDRSIKAFTSVITVAELSVGAYRSDRKEALEKTFDLISLVSVVDLDETIAREGGRIYSELMSEGKEIELNDCLIASTSLSLDVKEIITRDIEHFKRIEGINALTPEEKL